MSSEVNFDLTPMMAPYFDSHMIFPLLDFLSNDVRIYIAVCVKMNIIYALNSNY